MRYRDIITKINSFDALNFTMDDFNCLSEIIKEIKSIYEKEVLAKKIDAKILYNSVMEYLYGTIFDILKQKLQFEDEIINKIMCLIEYSHNILEVFVLDGNVIAKVYDDKNNNISFIPLDNFFDITSVKFNGEILNDDFKYFLMQSLNNFVDTRSMKIVKRKLLSMHDNDITYNLDNINIFVNNSLKSIIDNAVNNIPKVTRVILRFEDGLYCFDMKIRDKYIILSCNDYPVNKLSEILNNNAKIKKL